MSKKPLMKGLAGQNYKPKTNKRIKKIPYEKTKHFVDVDNRQGYRVERINFNVPLRGDKVFNTNIKANILEGKKMLELGFKEYHWYWELRRDVTPVEGVSEIMVLRIKKSNEDIDIYIYDNALNRKYDYQGQLYENEFHEYANRVHIKVQEVMMELVDCGVIEGYKKNDYI